VRCVCVANERRAREQTDPADGQQLLTNAHQITGRYVLVTRTVGEGQGRGEDSDVAPERQHHE
jgi:hypothetical protein